MTYLMIQDERGKTPLPEVRVALARAVYRARYGHEPAVVLVAPEQVADGAEVSAWVRPGLAWVGPVEVQP